jgi:hypothetical protein
MWNFGSAWFIEGCTTGDIKQGDTLQKNKLIHCGMSQLHAIIFYWTVKINYQFC